MFQKSAIFDNASVSPAFTALTTSLTPVRCVTTCEGINAVAPNNDRQSVNDRPGLKNTVASFAPLWQSIRSMSAYPRLFAVSNMGFTAPSTSSVNLPLDAAQVRTRSSQDIGIPSEYTDAGLSLYETVSTSPGNSDAVPMSVSETGAPAGPVNVKPGSTRPNAAIAPDTDPAVVLALYVEMELSMAYPMDGTCSALSEQAANEPAATAVAATNVIDRTSVRVLGSMFSAPSCFAFRSAAHPAAEQPEHGVQLVRRRQPSAYLSRPA